MTATGGSMSGQVTPTGGRSMTGDRGAETEGAAVYRTVWKYALRQPVMRFPMPADSEVIDVRTQDGVPTLWALGTLNGVAREREFIGFGTGHPIPADDRHTYVGSAHNVEGEGLVFHIFERVMDEPQRGGFSDG